MTTFTLIDHPDYQAPEPTTDTARRINSVLPLLTGMARRWLVRCRVLVATYPHGNAPSSIWKTFSKNSGQN